MNFFHASILLIYPVETDVKFIFLFIFNLTSHSGAILKNNIEQGFFLSF